MKTLIVHFDDSDYELLESVKNGKTWRELIMTLVKSKGDANE